MSERSLSDLTSHCIRCGFCLESCPTFTVTGEETESPRGRIYLIRSAEEGDLPWSADTRAPVDRCLGCRACETACPSGVEYGAILEIARERFQSAAPRRPLERFLDGLASPTALRIQLGLASLLPEGPVPALLSRLLTDEPAQADLPRLPDPSPWPPLDETALPSVRGEVYLLEGCAMRVMFPEVNEATRRLLRRTGFAVRESPRAGCCGALHAHAGFEQGAARRSRELAAAMPGDLPIIVNSAGCGSSLKSGPLGSRVLDASEFLAAEGLADALSASPGYRLTATYHDACHLAHGQRIRTQPRTLLSGVPGLTLVPLAESDACCGSAGVYNLTHPTMARTLLDRKWANIARTGAKVVVSGNPGCHAWIRQAAREHGGDVAVLHTMDALEASFSGLRAGF